MRIFSTSWVNFFASSLALSSSLARTKLYAYGIYEYETAGIGGGNGYEEAKTFINYENSENY